jgi:tRNA threonylcarbamoyladenosine biosynthesis protein TsaE
MKKTIYSSSEKETKALGAEIALKIQKLSPKKAVLITLSGDLGSGKTVFTKGFLASLGVKTRVTSPTFVVSKRYSIKKRNFKNVYHLDCYRIRDPKELLVIGLKEILADPQNIILIEWPDNAFRLSPAFRISINHLSGENDRKITISEGKI